MAYLEVLKGALPSCTLHVPAERMVLGRNPECEVLLENAAVSRYHAQILESHGTYYIEDLRSRNGTQLNGRDVNGRVELRDADEITVCEFVFRFRVSSVPPEYDSQMSPTSTDSFPCERSAEAGRRKLDRSDSGSSLRGDSRYVVGESPTEEIEDSSDIVQALEVGSSSNLRLGIKPEAKLRAIIEISTSLGRILDLSEVSDRILDGLLKLFPHADDGCVLLHEPRTGKLVVRATKHRDALRDQAVPISMTVVKKAMDMGKGLLTANVLEDDRFDASESVAALTMQSMMCTPLFAASGEAMGVVQISTGTGASRFSEDDLDLMISVASQGSLAIENALLHQGVLQQRDMDRELQFATQVQLSFLPSDRPKPAGYEFYDYYEPAQRVGGDYFDYVKLPGDRMAVVVADVAGKGIPAALLMARLYSLARNHLLTQPTVAEALTALNAEIATTGLGHRFITCVMAVLDPARHEVAVANAGHPAPIIRRVDGRVESFGIKESGMPLGILPQQQFQESTFSMELGETCLLYTDGVTDAMSEGHHVFGNRRLLNAVAQETPTVEQFVKDILAKVEEFTGATAPTDDTCLVAFRRLE